MSRPHTITIKAQPKSKVEERAYNMLSDSISSGLSTSQLVRMMHLLSEFQGSKVAPRKSRYSDKDKEYAIERHAEGWGYNKIADVLGCSPTTIRKWILDEGISPRSGPAIPNEIVKKAIDRYTEGNESIAHIAREMGITPVTVSRWLNKNGVSIRHNTGRVNRSEVLKDIKDGMKKEDIAKKHKCSVSNIYRIQSGK